MTKVCCASRCLTASCCLFILLCALSPEVPFHIEVTLAKRHGRGEGKQRPRSKPTPIATRCAFVIPRAPCLAAGCSRFFTCAEFPVNRA